MTVRKMLFAWLAASAASFVSRRVRSKRLRPVISRMALETRIPSRVSSGPRVISAGNSVPFLTQAEEFETGAAHGTAPWSGKELGSVMLMRCWETLWQQQLDATMQNFGTLISDQHLRLRIHKGDFTCRIDDNHRVGRGFQEASELVFSSLAEFELQSLRGHAAIHQ